jgi:Zn-dependent protease
VLPLDAAQGAPTSEGEATPVLYTVDTAQRTAREVWWWSRGPAALFAYLQWAFRRRLLCSVDDPPVAELRPFAVAADAVPADAREALAPAVAELAKLGFDPPTWHLIDDDLLHTRTVLATSAHPSGEAFARLHCRRFSFTAPPRVTQFAEFVSACDDGTVLWTLSTGPSFEPPPECLVERHPAATPSALWAAHRERLQRERFTRAVTPLRGSAAVAAAAERLHAVVRDRLLARGVFRPRTDDELRRAAALTTRRTAPDGDGRHADVLAEIDRLERPQTSWRKALLVLLASIVLFLAAGAWQWSLEYAALLIPVLLFHELGHWAAMRVFHYRNLRMFFIPFFGAAVSGRHYNVAGWKKVVVSLMGPVPGIILGTALMVMALLTDSDLARRLALVMVIVNGFNLLPVLPLDGGWAVRTLVFARHHLLDTIFALLAGGALLRFGLASDTTIFIVLGAIFLFSALTTYRTGLIVRDLRRTALPALPDDDDRMPPATADVIIDRVRAIWPTANARTTAQHTLRVFEGLNARPPGWLASIGLGVVYLGSIVLAGAALLGLTAGGVLLRPYLEPRGTVDSAAVIAPAAGAFPAEGQTLLIAEYDDTDQARAAHAALSADANGTLAALFGQSVIVSTPAGAEQQALAARMPGEPYLLLPKHAHEIVVSLTCHTDQATTAAALQDELTQFFRLPPRGLVPPWIDPDPRSAAERARHEQARRAWIQIDDATDTEEINALSEQLDDAIERDDRAAVQSLGERYDTAQRAAQERAISDLRRTNPPDATADLLDVYGAALAAQDADDDDRRWHPVMQRLGTFDGLVDADPRSSRQSAFDGIPSTHDTLLRVDNLRFPDVVHGPAALAAWLRAAGCGDQHYAFED